MTNYTACIIIYTAKTKGVDYMETYVKSKARERSVKTMLKSDVRQISREEKVDAAEIAEMARKLPDKEKERFFFMMKGVELMGEETWTHTQNVQTGA